MNHKKLIQIILGLLLFTMAACPGIAQKPQGQTSEGKPPESSQVSVIGRIEYLQSEGGYFLRGDHPYGKIFKIANQNPELLDKFLKIGSKHVNIEGRLTAGTNILFIEKIDGQPY